MYIHNPLPQNTSPSFSPAPPPPPHPLNLQTDQAPPFLGNSPLYIGFLCVNRPTPDKPGFLVNPHYIKFFHPQPLNSSHLSKVTKFLVKISQFKYLVMTEKNAFPYKLFLSLNISDFSYFSCKNCRPP